MNGAPREVNHYGACTVSASNKRVGQVSVIFPTKLLRLSSIVYVVKGGEWVAYVRVSELSVGQD